MYFETIWAFYQEDRFSGDLIVIILFFSFHLSLPFIMPDRQLFFFCYWSPLYVETVRATET